MSGRLQGRRILVVGGGTQKGPDTGDEPRPLGNGRAICIVAAREGAHVVVADRDEASANETVGHIEGGAHVVVGDVSDPNDCTAIVDRAAELMGGLDGLVCNVGIGAGMGLTGTTAEQWDHVFAVNARGHFLLAQAAFAHLGEGSAIVFISSIAGRRPGSRIPPYDASKAAVEGLSRHVAAEGARKGIRSNVVAPGLIDTPLGRWASAGRPSRAKTPVPLGRQGNAMEIAEPVVFLLSDAASYITGQVLCVDGGLSMG